MTTQHLLRRPSLTLAVLLALLHQFAAATPSTSPPHDPSMGLGLNGISYWGTSFPFLNLMRQAAGGTMTPLQSAPSGAQVMLLDAMEGAGLLDAKGWPQRLPAHYFWHAIVTADAGQVPSQRGDYLLRYRGEGDVRLITNGNVRSKSAGEIQFSITTDNLFIEVQIHSTDPKGVGDHVRDIAIVKQEHLPLWEAGLEFNPQWLALVRDMRVLRFMDWQFTNGSVERDWAARPTLDTFSWGVTLERSTQKGVPVEAMVALANHVGSDPWFTLPLHATDDYVRQFARYVAEHLDPKLIAYFEYSNEVWNWIFPQTRAAAEAGAKVFGEQYGEAPLREYYGYRSAQISEVIHQAFGADAKQRVHMTLATQTDDTDYPLMLAARGAEHYLKSSKRTLADVFDSVAVTWYFNIEPHLQGQIAQWREKHGEARARTMMFEQLQGKTHLRTDAAHDQPTLERMLANIALQAQFAQKHGLTVISYEGGTHLVGYDAHTESLADFFIAVNGDPRMGEIYESIYQGWQKIPGATLLNHFVEVGNHSKFGSWGALQHLEDSTARWDFLVAANRRPAAWEKRAKDAFLQGRLESDAKGAMQGTTRDDYFAGGNDKDTLIGGAGNDGLHGGPGDDILDGGPGDDVLVPGIGADILRGGPGADRFVFGFPLGNQTKVIEDFGEEDVLDFRGLLINVPRDAKVGDFFQLVKEKERQVLRVDMTGRGNFTAALAVVAFPLEAVIDLAQLQRRGGILFW